MRLTGGIRRPGRAVAAVALVLAALAGCGDEASAGPSGGTTPDATSPSAVGGRSLADYDLVVMASGEGNPLFADVYGLTLNPLKAFRVTTDKRISSLDADGGKVVVAAADGRTDRLAFVTDSGGLADIAGLGRPYAFAPTFDGNGTILYSDYTETATKATINRYLRWDAAARKKSVIFESKKDLYGPVVGPSGKLAFIDNRETGDDTVVVRDRNGKSREFTLKGDTGDFFWGERWLAVQLTAAGSKFGDKPTDFILLDPSTGKQKRVVGWQPISWTQDGTKVLARRSGNTTDSELALIDPDHLGTPQSLGTVPHLVMYRGAWTGDAAPAAATGKP